MLGCCVRTKLLINGRHKRAGGVIRQPFVLLLMLCLAGGPAAATNSLEAALHSQQPALLEPVIERYAAIVAEGGWQQLPDDAQLAAGRRHEDVRILRRRLRATGDYTAEMGADPLFFDAGLAAAIENFQRRYGLMPTGRLDRVTRNYLNVPAQTRLAQLRLARQNWAQLAWGPGERRLLVNIPEALLYGVNPDGTFFTANAIVGYPGRETPELSSELRRIVVHPRWTVPRSIALRDLVPKQRQNPDYFARNRIRVFDGWARDAREVDPATVDWSQINADNFGYVLRQDAGPSNSLGRYKFEFANAHDVYLHDTPGKNLLQLSYRTLSSGCVRVEQPERLAAWLAGDTYARALAAAEALPAEQTSYVTVAGPVRLDIVYLSAWVDPLIGELHMRHDVYGRISPEG